MWSTSLSGHPDHSQETAIINQTVVALPSPGLRDFVSHYWLGRHNTDESHTILPDGAVDLVIRIDRRAWQGHVFGSTTSRTDTPLVLGSHYLGVSFKPGQSRHFLRVAAIEITDRHEPAKALISFDLCDVPERIQGQDIFVRLDAMLERHLRDACPERSPLDVAISAMELSMGALSVVEAAAIVGKSVRQFERLFREAVGVTPKLFSQIARFRRASNLITNSSIPLVQIASMLGYTDQSHMTHEFKRFANLPPASYAESCVAFLQDRHPQVFTMGSQNQAQQGEDHEILDRSGDRKGQRI